MPTLHPYTSVRITTGANRARRGALCPPSARSRPAATTSSHRTPRSRGASSHYTPAKRKRVATPPEIERAGGGGGGGSAGALPQPSISASGSGSSAAAATAGDNADVTVAVHASARMRRGELIESASRGTPSASPRSSRRLGSATAGRGSAAAAAAVSSR